MRMPAWVLSVFLMFPLVLETVPAKSLTAETTQRTVRGTVTAINVTVDPPTIVVRVLLPNKEELIVGARVPSDTKITHRNQVVKLGDIKAGETVDITYLKAADGLIARSIHVR